MEPCKYIYLTEEFLSSLAGYQTLQLTSVHASRNRLSYLEYCLCKAKGEFLLGNGMEVCYKGKLNLNHTNLIGNLSLIQSIVF